MQAEDFVSNGTERAIPAVAEIKGLFEENELGMSAELLVAVPELREDMVGGGKMGNGVVICLRDEAKNEPPE